MFVVAAMKNIVRISPELFHMDIRAAIELELNKKLANKVIISVGLCIALFDITDIGESFIEPGDGSTYTKVNFNYIIFRPDLEEIIVGKVKSVTREGIHVTLGFFEDIIIPPKCIPHPSKFSEEENAWIWKYTTSDGESHDLFIDAEDSIRFRVIELKFTDITPQPDGSTPEMPDNGTNNSPFSIKGAICEQGLGCLHWWND